MHFLIALKALRPWAWAGYPGKHRCAAVAKRSWSNRTSWPLSLSRCIYLDTESTTYYILNRFCLTALYCVLLNSQSMATCLKSRYVYSMGMRADPLFATNNSEVPSLDITLQAHKDLSYCTSFGYKLVISFVTIGVLTTGPRLQNACNDTFLQPNYYTYSNSDHGSTWCD
jgi:hypothetical protein